jgi:MFS family permease
MAVGGAMVWPAVLGMTYGLLPEEKAGLAGGLIIGVAGIGNAIGPLLGGLLTDTVGWRWVFFLNVPITLVAMFVTYRRVDETSEGGERRIDYRGIATMSSGVILLLIGLDQGTVAGFGDPAILGLFVVGALLLGGFAVVERAAGEFALVPRQLVASRQFTAAISAVLMMSAIFFAVIVFVPQFMENELGWSALAAGAGLLPLMVVFAATSFVAGPLYNRLGARMVIGTGAVCLTAGVGMLAVGIDASYGPLVPGLLVLGVGVGFFYSSITTAAVTAVDDTHSSLAGGIVYMFQIAGGSIGLGLNTAIVLSASSPAEGITTAFTVDAVLGAVGTVIVLAFIGAGEHRAFHPMHRRHHRAHG